MSDDNGVRTDKPTDVSDVASPLQTPKPRPVLFSQDLYQWPDPAGARCPVCDDPVLWRHDGYLWHGVCRPRCARHVSMKPREWPE